MTRHEHDTRVALLLLACGLFVCCVCIVGALAMVGC